MEIREIYGSEIYSGSGGVMTEEITNRSRNVSRGNSNVRIQIRNHDIDIKSHMSYGVYK